VKLRMPELTFLFIGGGSFADRRSQPRGHRHHRMSDRRCSVHWSSPIWLTLLVAVATVSLAELRLRMRAPRTSVSVRQGLAGVAAAIGSTSSQPWSTRDPRCR